MVLLGSAFPERRETRRATQMEEVIRSSFRRAAAFACLLAGATTRAEPVAAAPTAGATPSSAPASPPARTDPHADAAPGAVRQQVPPAELSGIETPYRDGNEAPRGLANAMLWPFRLVVDLIFLTTGTAGALLENEQIVPRARDFFFTRGGELGIFPTVFLETGTSANVGARLIASIEPYAATVRAGYGGPDENVVEARMRLSTSIVVPAVLSLEGLHDRRTGRGYLGLGETPETDPRNEFQNGPAAGTYRERRERLIAGFGLRPLPDLEVLLSSSFTQRRVEDPADPDMAPFISQTFLPSSIAGAFSTTRVIYSELALRYDSRVNRSGVDTGFLVQGYVGAAQMPIAGGRFERAGLEAAAFLPFIHRTTILSPKITVDRLIPEDGTVPFTEMPGQPTFRGFANRRDFVSTVGSLDYRWYLSRFFAARLFFDVAAVAPMFRDISLDQFRWAGGFGFDLHTSTTELGRIAIAGSPEGTLFLFTLGVPARFGDRQHRD
jgi:hypothetical protein